MNRRDSATINVQILLFLLVLATVVLGTCRRALGDVTKTVSGLTEVQTTSPSDILMIVDVSDTSMALTGTNKKLQVQYLPQGFPAGSISGVTLNPSILGAGAISGNSLSATVFGAGAIAGATLNPSIFGPGAIAGATLNPSVMGSEAIAGATLTQNSRTFSIPFNFGTANGSVAVATGASVFVIIQHTAQLKGVDVLAYPTHPIGSGATIQVYRGVSGFPTIATTNSILTGSGYGTASNGATSFNVWSGGTYFYAGNVLVAYLTATSGNTITHLNMTLKGLSQ